MRAEPATATGPEPHAASALAALRVALLTALAYGAASFLVGALALDGPAGYASPLYPSAGIALAAVLAYGRAALPGVALGAIAFNTGLVLERWSGNTLVLMAVPLAVGLGAALQAAVGAALVRRHVTRPLVLDAPRDIVRFALLGALLACCISASCGTLALLLTGQLAAAAWLGNWLTWWIGDALGVLICAPLALTLVGRPRPDWASRRLTVGLPLLLALALLVGGILELQRLERQRLLATFERDADRLSAAIETRLSLPLHALQALHGVARVKPALDREALNKAAAWWLAGSPALQAAGYSERVPLDGVAAFEAQARAQGFEAYRVFDRDDGRARHADQEVLALRLIEPLAGNSTALGVNTWSIPVARVAIEATRDSGQPAATAGFKLTQASGDETGVVLYQALYRGEPADTAARRSALRGVVFVTLRAERALAGIALPDTAYLGWCLVDTAPGVERARLGGPPGCEQTAPQPSLLEARRRLELGGRELELRVSAAAPTVPGYQREASWLLSLVALGSASLLGALLLTVTGQSRRTERAVQHATRDLRHEIHERAAAESALRDSEQRLRNILDHAPIGVMFMDPAGQLIDCNAQLAQMIGQSATELRGRLVVDLVHPDDRERVRQMRRELRAGTESALLEPLRLRSAGHPEGLSVRAIASGLRNPQGELVRLVGVVQDITEHLRLQSSEQALQRAEAANRAKSEFLSRMSHELRTPLNAMIGFAQLLGLDREPALAAHQRDWTQQIQRAGWHLLEMINDTLDLARIESGAVRLSLAPLGLPALVAACRAMVATPAAARQVKFTETIDPDAVAVLGDATRLKQVITNLLSNAVKYNREGGSVTLTAHRVRNGSGADHIEIAVADTGLGMSPSQQAALFQPYNRLGREASGIEGTGIGLVISRRLTELMGGTLEASSAEGQGSIFTLRLPAAAQAEQPVARYTDTSPAPYQQRLVHYVEDNETNIEVMRGVLAQRSQIRLEISKLGLDGLAAVRASRPDLILLDMQLPDISGLELLHHLKQDDAVAHIPVVVVSADATTLQTQKALTGGALHYVTKPLDVGRFLKIVDDILEGVETRWG